MSGLRFLLKAGALGAVLGLGSATLLDLAPSASSIGRSGAPSMDRPRSHLPAKPSRDGPESGGSRAAAGHLWVLPLHPPPYVAARVDPTNYGERYAADAHGSPVSHELLVVLHETVVDTAEAIAYFQTPHADDRDQASYHALVTRGGAIVALVPADKLAFGAGNSVFDGPNGPETVTTNPLLPPSVNNFAYHVALETPADGRNTAPHHSGYTAAQYRALAWLLAACAASEARITTHRAVDHSGSRMDPRSLDPGEFLSLLRAHRTATAARQLHGARPGQRWCSGILAFEG